MMRTLSNALFAGAVLATAGSTAAFAGLGPFAAPVDLLAAAVPVASAPLTSAANAAPPTPFARSTGSGTIALDLPARYGTGLTITDYYCQNSFLSGPGTTQEPAIGVHGLLAGHAYTALFSATRTSIAFENISATPAMTGGAAPIYVPGQHAAGTVAVQTGPDTVGTSRQGSGSVSVDITCSAGTAPASAVAPNASAPPVAATLAVSAAVSTPGGPSPWGLGLAVAAAAALAGALVTRSRASVAVPSSGPADTAPPWQPRTRWEPPLDYPIDDPDREAKLRLDQLIGNARDNMNGVEASLPESAGGDNSVRGGGCLNIFGILHTSLGTSQGDANRAYHHWRDEYEKLVEQRRSFEGFQPRPPENAPSAGEGTDRQEIG